MTDKFNEVEVYKAYVEALEDKEDSVSELCVRLGIPRPTLYAIVKRIENGDEAQLQLCLSKSKYDCLWDFRYYRRYMILSEKDDTKYYKQLKLLISDMYRDGFGIREIGRRLSKDPKTILFHLKK